MRNHRLHLPLLLLVLISGAPDAGADGMLDPTFGKGGLVTTGFFGSFSNDYAAALAVMADGRAVAAGWANPNLQDGYMAVARYLPSGALDSAFGGGGTVTVGFSVPPPGFGSSGSVAAVLIQPDDRVVLVGTSGLFMGEQFALARLNVDGSLDATFGHAGKVTTMFGQYSVARAAVLQPDGRIVAVGNANALATPTVAAARYNPDGSLDPTFGNNGKVDLALPDAFLVRDVALQADGKLIIAGQYSWDRDFGLVRLLPDGTLDTSFDGDGLVVTDFNAFESGYAVATLPDGRLILGGTWAIQKWWKTDFALVRYLPDGTLDTSFGTGGLASADFANQVETPARVLALPSGKLLVAGYTNGYYTGGGLRFLLARFLADGTLDTSFGTAGFLRTAFGQKSTEECHAAVIAGPGRVLLAGNTARPPAPSPDFGLARYILDTADAAWDGE
jgi:uncharacterized delta-60 repeat protein